MITNTVIGKKSDVHDSKESPRFDSKIVIMFFCFNTNERQIKDRTAFVQCVWKMSFNNFSRDTLKSLKWQLQCLTLGSKYDTAGMRQSNKALLQMIKIYAIYSSSVGGRSSKYSLVTLSYKQVLWTALLYRVIRWTRIG